MATNSGRNLQNYLHLAGWHSVTDRNMAVRIHGNIVATLCANLIKIEPVTPEITRVTTSPFLMRWQKLIYPSEHLSNY